MLILSRRPGQEIVFPALGIKVRLVRLEGGTARVAIEAPRNIEVWRAELLAGRDPAAPVPRSAAHELCNRLSRATLSLHLFERLWQAGRSDEASAVLDETIGSLKELDRDWVMRSFAPPDARRSARWRTLVVDDARNECELLAALLSMNGCDCRTAFDGQEALDYLAANERPDFVLLDMAMPRRDGKETLEAIRAQACFQGLKVFSISPTPPEELGIVRGPQGIDAWFPKPLDPGKLWEAMQQAMAGAMN
jgi:carbon storage regulator CsrA